MVVSLLALLVAGQAAPPAGPAAGPQTLQQRFDAANEAAAARRCADAVTGYQAIEDVPAARRNPLFSAAIAVRKGTCLVYLDRAAEGEPAIRRGLPLLATKEEEFAEDLYAAQLALGAAARQRFDYDAAATAYRAALDHAKGGRRLTPLLALVDVTLFDRDGRALAAIEEARAVVAALPKPDRQAMAVIQARHARILLNEGNPKEAYRLLKDSLAKQGGLDSKVTFAEVATRSDLAIAALQTGDVDAARLYLAYTGAGRMRNSPFQAARVMDPPACGGTDGLTPQDQAIVEFSVEEDGRVSGVTPIFATGRRTAALAFARAVADWSWRPEDAKAIPLLFRYTTRVEMRCVKAPGAPDVLEPLREAAAAWMAAKGAAAPTWETMSDAAALPVQRAALAAASGRGDRLAALQAAMALEANAVPTDEEKRALHPRMIADAQALDAPVPVRTLLAVETIDAGDAVDRRRQIQALIARPDTAADPLSAASLRLLAAAPAYKTKPAPDAAALLDAVIDAPGLPDRHPLKIAAMLQKANVLAAANDPAGARAVFDRTGLTGEQCAMVGLQPAATRAGGSAADYPMAAVRMGFEGWVKTEFDVAADGRTVTPRAVIAYPPFVFDEAATGIVRAARFTSSFRPEGALACSGKQQSVIFRLP